MTAAVSKPSLQAKDRTAWSSDEDLLARFLAEADESAFAQLIQRHGPMVLGVCRRLLGNHHDAEDAFQATFVVLARKAGSIHKRERLGHWLYGVAHRTSLKLREHRSRREAAERQAQPAPPAVPPVESAWREVQQVLDEEMAVLDKPLRAAIVLCYLEGKTHVEAAREFGRPVGSMSFLLSRALGALRKRLADRGLTLTGGMSSLLLALQGPFPVSEELLLATLRALGVVGTASPLAVLIDAVLRELSAERASQLVRAVVVAILVILGASTIGFKALGSGFSSDPSTEGRSSNGAAGCCSH